MDTQTVHAYDTRAAAYAQEWHTQPAPGDMYALLERYFKPGPTADVGCGAGRDTAWLAAHGYDACGFDASEGLLEAARALHPGLRFEHAVLPELANVASGAYENVLCETVIMHLDPAAVTPAVQRLLDITRAGGTVYLSWRVTEDASQRDGNGRLYAAFDKAAVLDALSVDDTVLFDREEVSASSGKRIHRLIVRKGGTA